MNDQILATLNPIPRAVAAGLIALCPDTVLTSGRRSVADTARAEAANVTQNQNFIRQTYRHDPVTGKQCAVAEALQAWVDAQGACLPAETYEAAFLAILGTFSTEDLGHFSYHMTGNAFDVRPDEDATKAGYLKKAAADRSAAGGTALFLEREAGLIRWHWQGV
jgi:hypothetical protein